MNTEQTSKNIFTYKVLYHHCFPNDFVELFRTSLPRLPKYDYVAQKTNSYPATKCMRYENLARLF